MFDICPNDRMLRYTIAFVASSWFAHDTGQSCWSNPPDVNPDALIEFQPVLADDKAELGVVVVDSPGVGVLVTKVIANSPAETAAVTSGDFIVAIDGEAVDDPNELARLIREKSVGSTIAIDVWRDGQQTTRSARLAPSEPAALVKGRAWLGVRLDPEDPLSKHDRGARIAVVVPGGPAALAALRAGDLITAVGHQSIESAGDLIDAIKEQHPGAKIAVTVDRAGSEYSFMVELGRHSQAPFSAFRIPFGFDDDRSFSWPGDIGVPALPPNQWQPAPFDPQPWREEFEDMQRKLRKLQERLDQPAETEQSAPDSPSQRSDAAGAPPTS